MNDITKLPLWEECQECAGTGREGCECANLPENEACSHGRLPFLDISMCPEYCPNVCTKCLGLGRIPIRYTPEKAREEGYLVRDDDLLWIFYKAHRCWDPITYKELIEFDFPDPRAVLAIPGQGKPDKDWRPE